MHKTLIFSIQQLSDLDEFDVVGREEPSLAVHLSDPPALVNLKRTATLNIVNQVVAARQPERRQF